MNIAGFYRENGALATLGEIASRSLRRSYSALVGLRLSAGRGLNLTPGSRIRGLAFIKIGKGFYAGDRLWLEAVSAHGDRKYTPRLIIKDNVAVNDMVHIAATNSVEIGNNVLIASKVFISDHNHGVYSGSFQSAPSIPPNERPLTSDLSVTIGDNVWIGESVSVLPGARIGDGCVIGANSVVVGEIPPNSIAVGIPAKVIRTYDRSTGEWTAVR